MKSNLQDAMKFFIQYFIHAFAISTCEPVEKEENKDEDANEKKHSIQYCPLNCF